ncbi:hypothetical protein RB195_018599 [Necator americanus]|uniref:Uncharacterized protein n=1 Tax=Necator americanus TaxID=51031 RepID=A0ABR1CAH2_NECAM
MDYACTPMNVNSCHQFIERVPVVDPHHQQSRRASLIVCSSTYHGSEIRAAPSAVIEKIDCTKRKLLRRLLAYLWGGVRHNEDLYAEVDVMYLRMTQKSQHLTPPSKVATEDRLRFFGHIMWRPTCPMCSEDSPRFKLEEVTWPEKEVLVKKDLKTLGVDRQFR